MQNGQSLEKIIYLIKQKVIQVVFFKKNQMERSAAELEFHDLLHAFV